MAVELRTGRGRYRLVSAAPPEIHADAIVLALALERADGVERLVFRCRIARALLAPGVDPGTGAMVRRLAPWIEREFEATREAALKSIRAERRLLELVFDAANPGPFA